MTKAKPFRYNIRQVIDLTGVSEFTLRGWETRHKAFHPTRSNTGRRAYTKEDVLKIRILLDLVRLGHRIGKIANLNLTELEKLQQSNTIESSPPSVRLKPQIKIVQSVLGHVLKFEWNEVERIFVKALKTKSSSYFIHEFLLPLIAEINRHVDVGQLSIAQEHILSAQIKKSLNFLISQGKTKVTGPKRLVFATPEGDFHEIGLLIAAALSSGHGVQHLYLGPNVPAADLCETCLRYKATHAVITSTVSTEYGAKDEFLKYIHFLDRQLNPKIHLLLAGRNAIDHSIELKRNHKILSSFSEFESILGF